MLLIIFFSSIFVWFNCSFYVEEKGWKTDESNLEGISSEFFKASVEVYTN